MLEYTVSYSHCARYYVSDAITDHTEHVLIAIHGYGQLGQYFIKKFTELNRTVIIVPEAPSLFYLHGVSGRVGGSWMTKENRSIAIKNYIQYLNTVYYDIIEKLEAKDMKLTLLGFSQGVSTLLRWIEHSMVPFEQLILWAGTFPPELSLERYKSMFDKKAVSFVYGNNDPYLKEAKISSKLDEMIELLPEMKVYTFEGKHEIDIPTLKRIINQKATL